MTWAQVAIIALIVGCLGGGWYRYSRETVPARRLSELYLWLGPAMPFLLLAVLEAMHGRTDVPIVAPVAAIYLVLLAAARPRHGVIVHSLHFRIMQAGPRQLGRRPHAGSCRALGSSARLQGRRAAAPGQ